MEAQRQSVTQQVEATAGDGADEWLTQAIEEPAETAKPKPSRKIRKMEIQFLTMVGGLRFGWASHSEPFAEAIFVNGEM